MNNIAITQFVDDIVSYLNGCFANDGRIAASKRPAGHLAFEPNLVKNAQKSFFVVQILNNAPEHETFTKPVSINISLQIDIYALRGVFDGTQYPANRMSIVLQEAVSDYMNTLKFEQLNDNILIMREVTASPAMPFEDGAKAYTASIRYEFTISRDYVPQQNKA